MEDISFSDFKSLGEGRWILLGVLENYKTLSEKAPIQSSLQFLNESYFQRGNDFSHAPYDGELKLRRIGVKLLPILEYGSVFSGEGKLLQRNWKTASNVINNRTNENLLRGLDCIKVQNIDLENHFLISPVKLADIIPESILKNTAFKDFKDTKCVLITYKERQFIFPSHEIARFFYFKGSYLCDKIMTTSLLHDDKIKTKTDWEDLSREVLLISADQNYSDPEVYELARMSIITESKYAINNFISSLRTNFATKNECYMSMGFPGCTKSKITLQVSGIKLGESESSPFFVLQIHQSNDVFPFKHLKWQPSGDTRSVDDANYKETLPKRETKRKRKLSKKQIPTEGLKISSKNLGSSDEIAQILSLSDGSLGEFKNETPPLTRLDKTDQLANYKGGTTIIDNNDGNDFSTGNGSSSGSGGRIRINRDATDLKGITWKDFEYIDSICEVLSKDYSIMYYDGIKFSNEKIILQYKKNLNFCVVELINNEKFYYLFEFLDSLEQKLSYTALYYDATNCCQLDLKKIKHIVSFRASKFRKWPTPSKTYELGNLSFHQFTHQSQDVDISVKKFQIKMQRKFKKKKVLQ